MREPDFGWSYPPGCSGPPEVDDIIATVPWECGERDCPAQWHKSNYWISADGYSVDRYSDGDHEEIEEGDMPTPEEEVAAWKRYQTYVANAGHDPLDEYSRDLRQYKVRYHYVLDLVPCILGVALRKWRRISGPWHYDKYPPADVAEYIDLAKAGERLIVASTRMRLVDGKTQEPELSTSEWIDLAVASENVKWGKGYCHVWTDVWRKRSPASFARLVRKNAREHPIG